MIRHAAGWLFGGAVVAVVAYAAFKPASKPADAAAATRPVPVVVALSHSEDVPVRLEAQGLVQSHKQVDIRPQVASTVRQVHVREGQEVKAGQLLFTLDGRADAARTAQGDAQVAQIQAQLADAERSLARSRELLRKGFVAQGAVDSSQASVDALRAALAANQAARDGSRVTLGYQTLVAPFAGRVGAIDVHEGSLVQPGMAAPMLSLNQLDPVDVSFTLPQRELSRLLAAQAAGVVPAQALPDGGKPLDGKLVFIDNAVDASTGAIRVKAEFANPQRSLWPGAFVRVAVALGVDKQAVVLPIGAVQTGPDGQFVYVVAADSTVKRQPIALARVLSRDGKQFGVVTGLAGQQKVVAEGGQNLRPGGKVVETKPEAGKAGERKATGAQPDGAKPAAEAKPAKGA